MTINIKKVEDCFPLTHESHRVVPDFNFIKTDSPSFRFMRMQPLGDLIASREKGVCSRSTSHYEKCKEALKVARSMNVDVFLTPEYCIPIDLITEIIHTPDMQPQSHKLWCLCCEGVSFESFQDLLGEWADFAYVGKDAIEFVESRNFVGFLLYIFKSFDDDRLCIVPQIKLQPMREELNVCEKDGLSPGNQIILFGSNDANRLVTFICADSFHLDVKSADKLFPEDHDQNYIVLHPQLNPAPRDGEIVGLRNNIFGKTAGEKTVYITVNWAANTTISVQGQQTPSVIVKYPWSSIYRRYIHYDNANWNDKLRGIREFNFEHGLGFAFEPSKKIKVWFSNKLEHLNLISLRKPFPGGPEIVNTQATVECIKTYIFDNANNWVESLLPFNIDLSAMLQFEAAGDFEYALKVPIHARDRFFAYCLGHSEYMELLLDGQEINGRISYHIDDACEEQREIQLTKVANLIRSLKYFATTRYPAQIRRISGGIKFHLQPTAHLNIFSKDPSVRNGALVFYTDREKDAIQKANSIMDSYDEYTSDMREKVLAITRNPAGDLTYYPLHKEDVTDPVRVESKSNFTLGGLSIEPNNN